MSGLLGPSTILFSPKADVPTPLGSPSRPSADPQALGLIARLLKAILDQMAFFFLFKVFFLFLRDTFAMQDPPDPLPITGNT